MPSVTAISTVSSIASIPSSIKAAIGMGVSKEVSNTTIPIGISFHKSGSLIQNVISMVFVAALFGKNLSFVTIISVSLITTLMVAGIPLGSGGAIIMVMLSMIGCPLSAFPILQIFSQLTDMLQTLLNVTGNNVAAVVVNRVMNGKPKTRRDQ